MKYFVQVQNCRIVAALQSGHCDMSDGNWHQIETDESLVKICSEYVFVNGALHYVGLPLGNYPHNFDPITMSWVPDLPAIKNEKTIQLKQSRDLAEFGPFTYNGMVFDGDVDAQRRLSVLVSAAKSAIAAGYSFTKDFTLADNTVAQLTAEDFIGIEMAKLWQVDVAFQEYRLKKAAIEAAATLEELEAITI